jgi:hypothetical protein
MLYHNNNSKMDGLHVHGLSLSDDDDKKSITMLAFNLKLLVLVKYRQGFAGSVSYTKSGPIVFK